MTLVWAFSKKGLKYLTALKTAYACFSTSEYFRSAPCKFELKNAIGLMPFLCLPRSRSQHKNALRQTCIRQMVLKNLGLLGMEHR